MFHPSLNVETREESRDMQFPKTAPRAVNVGCRYAAHRSNPLYRQHIIFWVHCGMTLTGVYRGLNTYTVRVI